jgi:hypothetical protein
MNPGQADLTYYRGKTDLFSIQWKYADTPVDLTGYAATATIRAYDGSLLADTSSGITATITANTGTAVFTISDAVGRALPIGTHHYDVWMVSAGGIDYPILAGLVTVVKEVRSV